MSEKIVDPTLKFLAEKFETRQEFLQRKQEIQKRITTPLERTQIGLQELIDPQARERRELLYHHHYLKYS